MRFLSHKMSRGLLRSGICVQFLFARCSLLYVCNTLVVRCCALSAPFCACQTLSTGSSCCEENTCDIDKNRLFFFLVNPWPLLLRVTQAARRVVLAPLFALHNHVDDPPSETIRTFLLLNPSHFA